jgi:tRNA A37 threonylcarbamoyladenosine dehydratase
MANQLPTTVGNIKSALFKEQNYQFKTNNNMKTKTSILALTKAFFILLVMCCFSSCQSDKQRIENMDFKTITVDSCEYIISKAPAGDYGWVMSHKGNCEYCAKRSLK